MQISISENICLAKFVGRRLMIKHLKKKKKKKIIVRNALWICETSVKDYRVYKYSFMRSITETYFQCAH